MIRPLLVFLATFTFVPGATPMAASLVTTPLPPDIFWTIPSSCSFIEWRKINSSVILSVPFGGEEYTEVKSMVKKYVNA
jgi:hypothetical protein